MFASAACYSERTLGTKMGDPNGKGRSDVVFGNEALAAWARLTPEEKTTARATIRKVYSSLKPTLTIAIAESRLPNNADALVVREVGEKAAVIVLASENVSDSAFSIATRALAEDEARTRVVPHSRHLSVDKNGKVTELLSQSTYQLEGDPEEIGRGVSLTLRNLLGLATSVKPIDLRGIGRVKLFRFE